MNENEYKLEIYVTKDNVTIKNKEKIHTGEYKITKCEFEFTEDYEGLTKKAIFEAEDVVKEMPIISNECDIPEEVLQDGYLSCNLRVYGYDIEEVDGEMTVRLRYSPTYDTFPIWRGSFIPNAEQGEEITPTQFEQYTAALNEGLEAIDDKIGEVNTALENVSAAITQTNNLNLDVNKVDDTATVTLTKKDGTTKTVEITDGKDGEDGYTPVKGVDYYTEEEVEEIVNEITEKAEKDVAQANLVYNALPKVTGSGEEITLNNTAETPLGITLKGNTSQETTTGKQLFNVNGTLYGVSTITHYNNGFTLKKSTNRTLAILLPNTLNAGTYTLSTTIVSSTLTDLNKVSFDFRNSGGNVSTVNLDSTGKKAFTTTAQVDRIYVYISTSESDSATITFDNVMLESGSSASNWEEYTGGIPAPNPDYPQEVQVVTGDNIIKVVGKNLLDTNTFTLKRDTNRTISFNFPTPLSAGTYTISWKVTNMVDLTSSSICMGWAIYKSGVPSSTNLRTLPALYSGETGTSYTFTLTDTANYIYAYITNGAPNTATITLEDLQIEKSNQATTYTPYQSQEYEINLGTLELCKISTYQDYLYKSGENWYKHTEIGKYIANNDLTNNGAITTTIPMLTPSINALGNSVDLLSNLMLEAGSGDTRLAGATSSGKVRVYLSTTYATTMAEANTYLTNNNFTIYFPLATPTEEQITNAELIEQLNALYYAYAYQEQTNVNQENVNRSFIMNAETVRDLSNIFTNEE